MITEEDEEVLATIKTAIHELECPQTTGYANGWLACNLAEGHTGPHISRNKQTGKDLYSWPQAPQATNPEKLPTVPLPCLSRSRTDLRIDVSYYRGTKSA